MSFNQIRDKLRTTIDHGVERRDAEARTAITAIAYEFIRRSTLQSSAYWMRRINHAEDELRGRAAFLMAEVQRISEAYGIAPDADFCRDAIQFVSDQIDRHCQKVQDILAWPPKVDASLQARCGNSAAKLAQIRDKERERTATEIEIWGAKVMNSKPVAGSTVVNNYGGTNYIQANHGPATMTIGSEAATAVREALMLVREAVASDTGSSVDKASVLEFAEDCDRELARPTPNRNKLNGYLSNISAMIQTTAAFQPAYDAVVRVLKMLGLVAS